MQKHNGKSNQMADEIKRTNRLPVFAWCKFIAISGMLPSNQPASADCSNAFPISVSTLPPPLTNPCIHSCEAGNDR